MRFQEIVANLKKDPAIARGTAEGLLQTLQNGGFVGLIVLCDQKDGEAHKTSEAAKFDTLLAVVIAHVVHYGVSNRRTNEETYEKFINTLLNVLLIYVQTSPDFAKHLLEYYPESIATFLELCTAKGVKVDAMADSGVIHTVLLVIHALCSNVKRALVVLRAEDGVTRLLAVLRTLNDKNRIFRCPQLVKTVLEVLTLAAARNDALVAVAKANGILLLIDIVKAAPPTVIYSTLLTLFESLFKSDRIVKQAVEAGFIHWINFALRNADIAHVPSLLRHLKDMVRVGIGYQSFMNEGIFDNLLPHLQPYFVDLTSVQAACGLLFELQKQCSSLGGDAYVELYNLGASGFTTQLPNTVEQAEERFDPYDLCMELWDPTSHLLNERAADLQAAVKSAPIHALTKFCCTGPVVEPSASRMTNPQKLYRAADGLRVDSMCATFRRLLQATTNNTPVGTVVYDRQALENRTGTEPPQIYAPSPRSAAHLPRFHDDLTLRSPRGARQPEQVKSPTPWGDSLGLLRRTLSCPAKMFTSRSGQRGPLPTLRFDSRFESGNLHRAIQVGEAEYDLILSTDVNSRGYTQWFYFLVQNGVPGFTYKFNIVNLEKSDSVFSEGMRPCMFSSEAFLRTGVGWGHDASAEDICYHRNYLKRPYEKVPGKPMPSMLTRPKKTKRTSCNFDTDEEETAAEETKEGNHHGGDGRGGGGGEGGAGSGGNASASGGDKKRKKKVVKKKRRRDAEDPDYFYTLSFTVRFTYPNDTVYYAYSYPFTFSYLRNYLDFIESNAGNEVIRRQPLCFTRGGNLVELLTITEFPSTPFEAQEVRKRPLVVLTSRVHPGETNASWVMKGFLDWICSQAVDACELRKRVVFKIVPMLNPDGVIDGNYRCNLAGLDLNRCWSAPDPDLSPAIHATKRMIHALCKLPLLQQQEQQLQHHYNHNTAHQHFPCTERHRSNNSSHSSSSSSSSSNSNGHSSHTSSSIISSSHRHLQLRSLLFMCDIHGHSKMKDFCLYGCDWKMCGAEYWPARLGGATPGADLSTISPACLPVYLGAEKIFPFLLSQRAPHLFSFLDCKFNVTEDKASTARVVLWQEFELSQCFTLETTFCTASKGPLQGLHLSQFHFEEMGICLGRTLLDLVSPSVALSLLEPAIDRSGVLQSLIDEASTLQATLEAQAAAQQPVPILQEESKQPPPPPPPPHEEHYLRG